jgi:putative flippase GtrA
MKRLAKTFFIYSFSGAMATLVDWGSFYVMSSILSWYYMLAVCLSFTLGSMTNFTLNKYITFKNKYSKVVHQYLLHVFVSSISLSITIIIMYLFVEKIGMPKLNSRILTTLVVLPINFILHKNITFGMLK